jgi:hypothetical protein
MYVPFLQSREAKAKKKVSDKIERFAIAQQQQQQQQ